MSIGKKFVAAAIGMVSSESVSKVVMSVLMASAAILGVFVFVGTPVEKRVVQRQTAFVIKDILKDATLLGDAEAPVAAYVRSLRPPDMSDEDDASAATNSALIRKAAVTVGIAVAAGLVLTRWLSARAGFAYGPVLRQALVSCALAGATEVTFLLCFGQHFVSADPNFVRLKILEALSQQSSQSKR